MTQPHRLSTPRVPPLALEEMEPEVRALLERPGGFDKVMNVFATLAHHPKLLKRWSPRRLDGRQPL